MHCSPAQGLFVLSGGAQWLDPTQPDTGDPMDRPSIPLVSKPLQTLHWGLQRTVFRENMDMTDWIHLSIQYGYVTENKPRQRMHVAISLSCSMSLCPFHVC